MHSTIGSLVIDIQGYELTPEEKDLISHPLVGGLILFTRNYENKAQLKRLCHSVRQARKLPLLIMADQEGGRVQRFRHDFFALPPVALFGEWYGKDPAIALELSRQAGWLMANEVMQAGIDLSLAPVVDINKGLSDVIGNRAFHSTVEGVYQLAQAYIKGMREAGMSATIKHFPGHGSVTVDSHHATPVDTRTLKEILEVDAEPFRLFIQHDIPAVMAAHIIFPEVDAAQVSFSRRWLQEILRGKLGFKGTIISDDLNMQGANISANYADRVLAARLAGCDITLLCNNRAGVIQALDEIPHQKHQLSADVWQPLQANFTLIQQAGERSTTTQSFLQAHMR